MSNPSEKRSPQYRKPYVKPDVKQVNLKAEEAVLAACKIGGTAGPAHADCTMAKACSAAGS